MPRVQGCLLPLRRTGGRPRRHEENGLPDVQEETAGVDKRIASHPRLYGRKGQYATVTEHMPPNHQLYSEWNGNRFRSWARKVGESAFAVVDKLLLSYRVEEQAYKGCLSLLKLSEKYGAARLELACQEALRQVPVPRYSIVSRILTMGQDQKVPRVEAPKTPSRNAFVRGSSYYGGDHHEG